MPESSAPSRCSGEIMTAEIAVIISALSLAFAVYQGTVNMRRTGRKDTKEDSLQIATVMVKLEDIDQGVKSIRMDIKDVKSDIRENRERIIKAEESIKQAHRRIDEINKEAKQ